MTKVAIIAAAGWKGTSSVYPHIDRGIPEPLLPLNNGMTILSRYVAQLRALDYIPFVGIGQPGSLYPQWADLRLREGVIDVAGTREGTRPPGPWTWARVEYVRAIGAIPILIESPSEKGFHHTIRMCINAVGLNQWDEILLTYGDYVFSDKLLTCLARSPYPAQIWMSSHSGGVLYHIFLRLDVKCVNAYLTLDPWDYDPNKYGYQPYNDKLRKVLEDAGAPIVYAKDVCPELYDFGWTDIDIPNGYNMLMHWIKTGKMVL